MRVERIFVGLIVLWASVAPVFGAKSRPVRSATRVSYCAAQVLAHVDSLAMSLHTQAIALEGELAAHFHHARQHQAMLWHARDMARVARHVRIVASRGGDFVLWHNDLRELDLLYDYLNERFDHIDHDAYHGQANVYHNTAKLSALMDGISRTLWELRETVETVPHQGHDSRSPQHSVGLGWGRTP